MDNENFVEPKYAEEIKDTIRLRKLIAFVQSLVVIFSVSSVINIDVVQLVGYTAKGYEIVVSNYHLFLLYSVLSSYITIFILRIISFVFSEEDNNFYPSLVTMQTFNTAFCVSFIGVLFLVIRSFSKGVIPFNIYDKWLIAAFFFGFHLLGYYFINYYFSRSLIKLPPIKSFSDKKSIKSRIKLMIKQPSFHFISIPIWFVVFFQVLYFTTNIFSYVSDYNNKPAEYFDTPFKRQLWWHSQDREWKEVFKTIRHKDYTYSLSISEWVLDELRYLLGMPYFPNDEYILYIFNNKNPYCERFASEAVYQPPRRMSKYLTNLSGVSSLTNIKSLYLNNSRINNFENLEKLKSLKTLWLENANLNDLAVLNNLSTNLTSLRLDYNNLTNLEGINKLKDLKVLYCSNNNIETLEGLLGLKNLEFLDCNNNNIKSIEGLSELENLKTLIIYKNPVVGSGDLGKLNVKNIITTEKEFFEWQGNGHYLCEVIFERQTGFYKKYGYLTYNLDSLTTILPMGDRKKLILEFNDSTIVVKREKGYNKFLYKVINENDSLSFDYDLIDKVKTED